MNSKRCPCGELFVIGFSLDSEVATVLCRRPKGHTGPHSISGMNFADVLDEGHSPAPPKECPACGFPENDGYVHPVLPTETRCDHRHISAPMDATIQHTIDRYGETLRKLANTDPLDQVDPGKSRADGVPRKPKAPAPAERERK